MDHRLNVVTYWYLLERNKIAEHDISFVCAPLFGVVIEYRFCLLSSVVRYFKYYFVCNMLCCVLENDHAYLECTCSLGCNTLFLKEIAKTTLQSRIIQKSIAMWGIFT